MTIWYKQGVYGDLGTKTQKCKGRVGRLYESNGEDMFVTSQREGNHMMGSLHETGCAFDFRKGTIPRHKIKYVAGPDFDVVEEPDHYHVEYDPKN